MTCSYAVARTVQFRCDHDLHMEPFLFIHAGTCMPKIAERTESLWLSGDRSVLEVLDQILYKAGACSLQCRPHSEVFSHEGRQTHIALVPQPATARNIAYILQTLMPMSRHHHSL